MSSIRTPSSARQVDVSTFGAVDRVPRPLTSFIGRDDETRAVAALLARDDVQLVTITGPGGIGKTRLAIEVTHRARSRFRDGVAFLALAELRESSLLPMAIASALGVRDVTGRSLIERIGEACRNVHLLLVLDNLEHLLDATPVVAEILEPCAGLVILGTSRVRLGLSGEHVYPVSGIAPDAAVELFEQRARALVPGFTVTADSRSEVAQVCRRLDGMPLAIELAAARVPVLAPRALRARLDDRLALLTEGRRDAPDRHQGLRQTIAWSHDLLSLACQVVFRRLAVFDGGFTLDAATAVAGNGGDVLEGVATLEANSLLKMTPGWQGEPRFSMLETIREYALERLDESGEGQETRRRFAAWYSDLAADFTKVWFTDEELDILDKLEWEYANFRAALGWYERTGDMESALRLAGSLGPLWAMHGHGKEGRSWLERAIGSPVDVPAHVMAVALRSLSRLLNQQAVGPLAMALAERALALSREEGDQLGIVQSLILCGVAAFKMGDLKRAVDFQHEALALLDATGNLPWTQYFRGVALTQLGNYCVHLGAIAEAQTWYARTVELDASPGSADSDADFAIDGLGDVARAQGDDVLALQRYQHSLGLSWDDQDLRAVAYALGGVAGALAALRHHELAARLFGASEALHENLGVPFAVETFDRQRAFGLPEPWAAESTTFGVAQRLRDALGNRGAPLRRTIMDRAVIDPAWQEGRGLTPEVAVAEALAVRIDAAVPAKPNTGGLTEREVEVLQLLAQHHSNREIAALLSISPRTVENHVLGIYTKLNLSSRSAATAWAIRHGLG
jgi:predicted ATPase/DNA-binding CsgD family transcriptional regulator